MLLHKLPESIWLWPVRGALIHQNRRAVRERPIDNVTVAGDPAYIGRAPVYIILSQVKYVFASSVSAGQIASTRMHDPLGLPCRTARVENEERVLTIKSFCRTICRDIGHRIVPPDIPSLDHRHLVLGAL